MARCYSWDPGGRLRCLLADPRLLPAGSNIRVGRGKIGLLAQGVLGTVLGHTSPNH